MNRRICLWAVLVIALTWATFQPVWVPWQAASLGWAAESLGKVTVTSAGTPVQITATSYPGASHLSVQALDTNAGAIYLGRSGMSKTTFVGVIYKLQPGQAATINLRATGTATALSDYYLDADTNDDAGLCSFD